MPTEPAGTQSLPIPRRQLHGDHVTGFFAEKLAGFGLDGQLVHAASHRHERTAERMSVYRSPNLHQAAGFEERGRFRPDNVTPAAFRGALAKLRGELHLDRLLGCHLPEPPWRAEPSIARMTKWVGDIRQQPGFYCCDRAKA